MYIKPVDNQEILNFVNEFKSKVSTDCDELNMTTVKHIIPAVIEPFTYICNLSFTSGIVPNSMKIAKNYSSF